jgi:serine/threonine kinase PknH
MSDAEQNAREGSLFGPYLLNRLLGSGAAGAVYQAQDTVHERVVALKLLSPSLSADPAFRERMEREVLVAERLDEPHVIPVNDHGDIDGRLFIDMRLIEGVNLAELLQEHRELPPPRAVSIVRQVAAALDAAHAAGIVHCDVKPENILVSNDDFAYLTDFGIADSAVTDPTTPVESLVRRWRYTAPERFAETEANHQVDVYALACVLYECLTGWPPYRADDADKLVAAHLSTQVPRPSQLRPFLPATFDEVIAHGMAKDPRQRYLTAGDLALASYRALSRSDQELVRQVAGPGYDSTPPSAPAPGPPPSHPPPQPAPVFAPGPPRQPEPASRAWTGEFSVPPFVFNPPRRRSRRRLFVGISAAAAVVVLAVVGLRLSLHPSETPPANTAAPETSSATPATTTPAAEAQARLLSMLPPGYPSDTCKTADPPKGALAAVFCGQNIDPDGPISAAYTLYPDQSTLRSAFDRLVQLSAVIVCPGRIQSPGAWHHVDSPDTPGGMVLCAATQGNPTIGWTNDTQLLIGVVQSVPQGPPIDPLFGWWSSHS